MKKTLLAVMAMVSLCGYAQTPIEGFESPWTGNPAAPPGWIVVNEQGPLATWTQSLQDDVTQPAYEGNHAAYLQHENVAPSAVTPKDWLISPSLIVPQNSILRFQSRLTIDGDQGGIYKVFIGTNPADLNTFTEIYSATELQINPVQTEYTLKQIEIPVTAIGQQMHIAFVMIGDDADRWLIDNVEVLPVCSAPINLTAVDLTETSATLAWTETGFATAWEIEVIPAAAAPSGQGIPVQTNPFVVNGLLPAGYKYYVRAICSDGGASEWVGPFYFSGIITENVVSGVVKYDTNGDTTCGEGDLTLPGAQIQISIDGTAAYSIYTNVNGEYTIYNLPDGISTLNLQVIGSVGFPEIPVLVEEVEFDEENHDWDIVHCLPQPAAVSDLSVTITPYLPARPGFTVTYKLVVQNKGNTVIEDAAVNFTFNDARMNYLTTDFTAPVVTTNNIAINIGDLAPYSTEMGDIIFSVLQPPVNIGGEILVFTAELSDVEDDATPDNNTAVLNQTIVNSYDPNDITVHEGAEIYQEQADDYLTYTVRFQNTGTADAVNIRLENTLDELLDWDTFTPIASSHNYTAKRIEDKLEFYYANIHLPDSTANEPGSHGYITYRIKPKANFGIGNTVYNTAEIYFDFNPAIVTNTASTKVIEMLGVKENELTLATLYPNPVKDQLHIAVQQGELQSVTVYDINGRACLASATANVIDTHALGTGMYFVKVITDAGNATYKIMKH